VTVIGLLRKFDFIRNLFGSDESAARAKERLRIVLIQDQSSISSDLLNKLRHEMIGVVSRYLEIDVPHLEMGIERREGSIALAASIPIVRIRKEGRALIAESQDPLLRQASLVGKEALGEAAEIAIQTKNDRRQRRGRRHLR